VLPKILHFVEFQWNRKRDVRKEGKSFHWVFEASCSIF